MRKTLVIGLLWTGLGALVGLAACDADQGTGPPPGTSATGGVGGQGSSGGAGGAGADAGAGADGGAAPSCQPGPDLAGSYARTAEDVVVENEAGVYRWVDVEHDDRSDTFAVGYVMNYRTYLRSVDVEGGAPSAGTRVSAEDDGFCCNSGPIDLAFASGSGSSLGLLVFVDDRLSGGNGLLEIWGQLFSVAPGGGAPTKIGTNFDISQTAATGDETPGATYDPSSDRFVVFWGDDRAWTAEQQRRQIFGRSVGTDGSLGQEFQLAEDTEWQVWPNAAAGGGSVLVVWSDYVVEADQSLSIGVRGRLVNAAGSTTAGPIIEISRPGGFQDPPAIAYDERRCQFLVAWPEPVSPAGMQIAGALLDGTGAIVRERFVIVSPSLGAGVPRLAYNRATGSYLLAYHAWQSNGGFAVELAPNGAPAGDPVSIHQLEPSLGTFFQPVAAGPEPSFLVASLEDYNRIEATLFGAPTGL